MRNRTNVTIFFAILGAAAAMLLSATLLFTPDSSAEGSDALVKGRPESGYEYVGFIVSDSQKVCAGTLIDENTIVTAAHCLSETAGEKFSFGIGAFTTDVQQLTPISVVSYAPGFNPETNQGPDLALARLSQPIRLSTYAVFSDATESCSASIVAYGAGIESGIAGAEQFQKKSGEGCVRAITSNFLIIFNREVGMCFGDSGGPIFADRGSNEIVGILSGGLIDTRLERLVCDPGNTGYAVTTSSFAEFLSDRDFNNPSRLRIVTDAEPGELNVDLAQLDLDTPGALDRLPLTQADSGFGVNVSLYLYVSLGVLVILSAVAILRLSR